METPQTPQTPQTPPHKQVHKLIQLDKEYTGLFAKLKVLYDAILHPVYSILTWICIFAAPSVLTFLGISTKITWISVLSLLITLNSAWSSWKKYAEYSGLHIDLLVWKIITQYHGGPRITWYSSSEPRYEWFVYADMMERLKNS